MNVMLGEPREQIIYENTYLYAFTHTFYRTMIRYVHVIDQIGLSVAISNSKTDHVFWFIRLKGRTCAW